MLRIESARLRQRTPVRTGGLRVAELAEQTGVTATAIRYYARAGLLSPARSPDNGYRCFSPADRRRVQFIRKAQAVGLTISDIKDVLAMADLGEVPCDEVRARVAERLGDVRRKLAELHAAEQRMRRALAAWDAIEPVVTSADEICPLIEGL